MSRDYRREVPLKRGAVELALVELCDRARAGFGVDRRGDGAGFMAFLSVIADPAL